MKADRHSIRGRGYKSNGANADKRATVDGSRGTDYSGAAQLNAVE
jgi:hypothetical protein